MPLLIANAIVSINRAYSKTLYSFAGLSKIIAHMSRFRKVLNQLHHFYDVRIALTVKPVLTTEEFIVAVDRWSRSNDFRFKQVGENQCVIYSRFNYSPIRGYTAIEIHVKDAECEPMCVRFTFRANNILYIFLLLLFSYLIVRFLLPQWESLRWGLGFFTAFAAILCPFLKFLPKWFERKLARRIVNEALMLYRK